MPRKKEKTPDSTSLRKKAEKLLPKHPKQPATPSVENLPHLIHELQVHQIELEMQNEELQRQQAETEEAKDRYLDLYDFAPTGYFTFDAIGRIAEVNLTGASLLGLPRSRLIGSPFSVFVERDFVALFRKHLHEVIAGQTSLARQTCELKIRPKSGKAPIYVSLDSIASKKGEEIKCRSAVIDITERKRLEGVLLEYERVTENSREMIAAVDQNFNYVLANALFLKYQGLDRSRVIGKPVRDIVGEDVFETEIKKKMEACFRGEAVQFERKRVFPELGERDLLVGYFPVENPDGINRIVIIFQDITDRKRAENVAQARLRMLAAANSGALSVDEIIQRALDEIESQTGSKIGFYHFLEADQETISLQNWSTNTVRNMCTAEGKGSHYPISRAGVWVDCVRERRPVIHNDLISLPHRKGMPPGHAPVIREMVVPILRGGKIVAIIGVGNKPADYHAIDIETASLLGDISWEIVERKRAEEALRERTLELQHLTETLEFRVTGRTGELAKANKSLRRLSMKILTAQEDERKRIAGELHDTIGSCLAAAKFKVMHEAAGSPNESLDAVTALLQESIDECRRIQMDLRPPMLDDLGLLMTLSWFFRRFQTIYSGIRIEHEIAIEEDDVPPSLKTIVYRVTQEAMNNIAKYSKADLARLSLRKRGGRMEFAVRDNGQGFDLEKVLSQDGAKKGLGLTSMKERTELSGGSFAMESTLGKGTIIFASWPLEGAG